GTPSSRRGGGDAADGTERGAADGLRQRRVVGAAAPLLQRESPDRFADEATPHRHPPAPAPPRGLSPRPPPRPPSPPPPPPTPPPLRPASMRPGAGADPGLKRAETVTFDWK